MPDALQMLLRETQSIMYYDQKGQIRGGGQTFVYQAFTTQISSTGNIIPSPLWKSLRL
jgi:hypothetical protein